ncbi:MAG: response regulator transcription factor [Chitinophagaceae bacterium]|nr:response regulator transcription factor [Anaerolineae bacterium]
MAMTILLIGGSRVKQTAHVTALQKHYQVILAASGKQGIEAAKAHKFNVVILDSISLGTPGERICRSLSVAFPSIPIVHLVQDMPQRMPSSATVVLCEPIKARRLLTCLERLLQVGQEEILEIGPFCMNVARRLLVAHGKETQLTPKLGLLVEMFLRHPGQIIDRKLIMEKVWETDYLGDTRTLDVHIRWVRQVLDDDSKKPRYLKTVRGVGYCLEVPELEKV